ANVRASPVKSCESTPTKTTPRGAQRRAAASSVDASRLHASHHDAQKLRTTTRPRSEDRRSLPRPSTRASSKLGAAGRAPFATAAATWAPRCASASRSTSRTRSDSTSATDPARASRVARLRIVVHPLQGLCRAKPEAAHEGAVLVVADRACTMIELELTE